MLIKLTSKRQATFPAAVLESLGAGPGDYLELQESKDGFILRPHRVAFEKLAPLKNYIAPEVPTFDLETFRNQSHDPSLRD